MTISAVSGLPPPPGFRLIDGGLIDEIITQLNLSIAALNAGGGSGSYTNLTVTGNTALGDSIADTIGFYGVTGVAQQASASQAAVSTAAISAVATTGATNSSPYGYTTSAQADAIVTAINAIITRQALIITLVNELRLDLVTIGAIKGAA
jgi:hypothetical protein